MPTYDLDGHAIEYRLIPGDAQKPYLVFLHEGLGSVSLWRDFPDKVARRTGCRALVYSRYGYGKSSPLREDRKPVFMHDEASSVLPRLLAGLRIMRPVLIGHSDGASIALIAAAGADRSAQSAPQATILIAPHVFVEPICIDAIEKIGATFDTTDLRTRLMRHHAHVDHAFHGWRRIWLSADFRGWTLEPEIRRLRVPTLLIQGDADPYGTVAHIDRIAAQAPGPVQKLILAGCGHAPHREQPETILDAISGFMQRRPPVDTSALDR
jgi:pimeloyl-ACP methyl ester carboxylesterase